MFLFNYELHLLSFLYLFLHLVFFEFPSGDAAFDTHCSTTICDGVNISYPFWVVTDADMYCGYRDFGLNCSDGNTTKPILDLPEDSYYVTDINYDNNFLTLVDKDVSGVNCPRVRHNLTVGTFPLSYNHTLDVNISFYFDCTSSYANGVLNLISCWGIEDKHYSYVFIEGEEPEGFLDVRNSCEEKVVAAVKDEAVSVPNLNDAFDEALNGGFVLDWDTAKECGACEHSKGKCGYNNRTGQFLCFCDDESIKINGKYCSGSQRALRQKALIAAGIVIGGSIMTIILFYFIKRPFLKRYSGYQDIEDFIKQHGSLAPKRYKYSEVKRITNSFRDKLGQGGYGAVYKGILRNGCSVAVKMLNIAKGNGEEFINEVASISRTSHVNIVTLLGFCYEGKRRALIYEFMANGSLDKFINDGTAGSPHAQLGWEKLYQIAIRIARGLEYLHRGCNTRILHFDIKPHNILLDEEFNPKISDFGLAKLCLNKESIVSMMTARGTIGYIAPEVFNRNFGGVSPKSDVYSFGMMVLEMIGATKKIKDEVDGSSQLYFPDWIYTRFELGQELETYYNLTSGESEILRKMVLIGLRCIQINPSERPSMSKVIEMLEGSVQALPIPPKPFFTTPTRAPEGSYSTSILLIQE